MNKQRQHRRIWNQEQDQTLKTLVQQSTNENKPKWKQIAQKFNQILQLQIKRNPKQCRQRWYNSLAPNSKHTKKWDIQDDVALIEACKKHGHRWSKLAKEINHCVNDNQLKNHFYSTVRKLVRVINTILKNARKQHQQSIKNNTISQYSENEQQIIKQAIKLRNFQPKLLSKIFSLIDSKQQYKYQAKQSLSVQNIQQINNQILDYMLDFITEKNQFSNIRILQLIVKVMNINKVIKTKYIRQVKMSLQDQQQIQKVHQLKKKRERKINNIVKQQLDFKIIPDKKTKAEIIRKIGEQNKTLKKLIRPINHLRIRGRLRHGHKKQKKVELVQQKQQKQYDNFFDVLGQIEPRQNGESGQIKSLIKSRQFNINQNIQQQKSIRSGKQSKLDRNSIHNDINNPTYAQLSQNFLLASQQPQQFLNPMNNSRQIKVSSPGPMNFSQIFNIMPPNNNLTLSGLPFLLETDKVKIQQEIQPKHININTNININMNNITVISQSSQFKKSSVKSESNVKQESVQIKHNPFASNFLNTIPLLTSNNSKNIQVLPHQDLKQLINPFFPQHKLTHSQGYFSFDQINQLNNMNTNNNNINNNNNNINNTNNSKSNNKSVSNISISNQPSQKIQSIQKIQNIENQHMLSRSNPNILASLMYPQNSYVNQNNNQRQQQQLFQSYNGVNNQINPALRGSRFFQGLFSSFNYQNSNNNDRMSQHSQRLRNSLFQLVPNFHPMHTSAFCHPISFNYPHDNYNINNNNNQHILDTSHPFSAQQNNNNTHNNNNIHNNNNNTMNNYLYNNNNRLNMFESQPIGIQMLKSSQLINNGESNHSGNGFMYHSYSFGQLSQDNISGTHSKKRK